MVDSGWRLKKTIIYNSHMKSHEKSREIPKKKPVGWCLNQKISPFLDAPNRDNRDNRDLSGLFPEPFQIQRKRHRVIISTSSNQWYTMNCARSSQLFKKTHQVFKSKNFWHCLLFHSFLPERSTVTMGCCHASTVSTASELQVRCPGRPDSTMDKLDYDISNFTGFLVMK